MLEIPQAPLLGGFLWFLDDCSGRDGGFRTLTQPPWWQGGGRGFEKCLMETVAALQGESLMVLSPKGGGSRGPGCSGWHHDLLALAWGMMSGCTGVGHDPPVGSKTGVRGLRHPWSLTAPQNSIS